MKFALDAVFVYAGSMTDTGYPARAVHGRAIRIAFHRVLGCGIERGIAGVGVDALTEAAGMTRGSLYSHFGSKERLDEEAVAHAIAAKGQEVPEGLCSRRLRFRIPLGGASTRPAAAVPSRLSVLKCRDRAEP
jgi:AcrR family transcriptional regulator